MPASLLLTTALLGLFVAQAHGQDWQTFRDDALGIRIDYPASWFVRTRPGLGDGLGVVRLQNLEGQVVVAGGGPLTEDGSYLEVSVFHAPGATSIEDWLHASGLPARVREARLRQVRRVDVQGTLRPVWFGQGGGADAGQELVVDGWLYRLHYVSGSAAQFTRERATFARMVASFRIDLGDQADARRLAWRQGGLEQRRRDAAARIYAPVDLPPDISPRLVSRYLVDQEGITSIGGVVFATFDVMAWDQAGDTTTLYLRCRLQEYSGPGNPRALPGRLVGGAGSDLPLAMTVVARDDGVPRVTHRVAEEGEGVYGRDLDAIFPGPVRRRLQPPPSWRARATADVERQARRYFEMAADSLVPAPARLYGSPSVDDLIAALSDPRSDVRMLAARQLHRRAGEAPDRLLVALSAADPFVRATAAAVLGQIREPRALEGLLVGLQDDDPRVVANSALALGRLGDPRAAPPLADALRRQGGHTAVVHALAQIDAPQATQALIDLLGTGAPRDRRAAAQALRDKRDPSAFEPLVAVLQEGGTEWYVVEVVDALGALGDRRAVVPLIAALKSHPRQEVRAHAALALGSLGDERARAPLNGALQDSVRNVRSLAAAALDCLAVSKARGNRR